MLDYLVRIAASLVDQMKKLFIVIYNKFVSWLVWWILDVKSMKTGYFVNFHYLGYKKNNQVKRNSPCEWFFIGKCDWLTNNWGIDLWYGIAPFDTWILLSNLTIRELDIVPISFVASLWHVAWIILCHRFEGSIECSYLNTIPVVSFDMMVWRIQMKSCWISVVNMVTRLYHTSAIQCKLLICCTI